MAVPRLAGGLIVDLWWLTHSPLKGINTPNPTHFLLFFLLLLSLLFSPLTFFFFFFFSFTSTFNPHPRRRHHTCLLPLPSCPGPGLRLIPAAVRHLHIIQRRILRPDFSTNFFDRLLRLASPIDRFDRLLRPTASTGFSDRLLRPASPTGFSDRLLRRPLRLASPTTASTGFSDDRFDWLLRRPLRLASPTTASTGFSDDRFDWLLRPTASTGLISFRIHFGSCMVPRRKSAQMPSILGASKRAHSVRHLVAGPHGAASETCQKGSREGEGENGCTECSS